MESEIMVRDNEGDVGRMESERKLLAEEFNVQRAKMKELFLQKEEEMRKLKSEKQQLESEVVGLRSQLDELNMFSENQKYEIESMQMLMDETMETSRVYDEEVRKVRSKNLELEQQVNLLQKQATQDTSLAPAALVHTVTRSIARKLGADAEEEKKLQDDAELIRPLEEEIKALKEKLRETDSKLQLATKSPKAAPVPDGESKCFMCNNYEQQLVAEQAKCEQERAKAKQAESALKIATNELEDARSVHEETIRCWHTERANSSAAVAELKATLNECVERVERETATAHNATLTALDRVTRLTVNREMLQHKLETLERDNAMLVGKYTEKARDMQSEDINLPDNFEELQEYTLRLREDLIKASLGREEALQSEMHMRTQLLERTNAQQALTDKHQKLIEDYQQLRQSMDVLEADREQMNELGNKLRSSNTRLEELLNDKKRLQNEIMELRSRVSSLQLELDNSEKVQQDFVRLSQSLQVQLERIREADTEVRWQHEEDVSECPACHTHLPNNKRKVHCRHCGRIFCASCVSHSVASGPRGVPARVCSVCRTLLQPHTAPYFSTEAPHAPD